MKLTTIISGIRSLDNVVEEISIVKKFFRAVPPRFMQIFTSIEQLSDLKNMSVEAVVGCLKVHEERLHDYEDKEGRNSSYMRSDSHGRKRKKQMTLLSQVRGDVATITKKTKVVDVVMNVAADVVAEEVVILPHKPIKMPTLRRTRV